MCVVPNCPSLTGARTGAQTAQTRMLSRPSARLLIRGSQVRKFDALLDFAHLGDFWTLERVHPYGEPAKGRERPH